VPSSTAENDKSDAHPVLIDDSKTGAIESKFLTGIGDSNKDARDNRHCARVHRGL